MMNEDGIQTTAGRSQKKVAVSTLQAAIFVGQHPGNTLSALYLYVLVIKRVGCFFQGRHPDDIRMTSLR
jgi:hypothetical protein